MTSRCLLCALGMFAGSALGCGPTDGGTQQVTETIHFSGEHPFLTSLSRDNGLLPSGAPVQLRMVASGGGTFKAEALGRVRGSELEGLAGSGQMEITGQLSLELFANIEEGDLSYDGPAGRVPYPLPAMTGSFDPFAIDSAAELTATLPAVELGTHPVPALPGATVTLSSSGGTLTSSLRGICARVRDRRAQYTGQTTTSGRVTVRATIEIDEPGGGVSRRFGPIETTIHIPPLTSTIDLGTFTFDGMRASPGTSPCALSPLDAGPLPSDSGMVDAGTAHDGGMVDPDGGICGPNLEEPDSRTETNFLGTSGDYDENRVSMLGRTLHGGSEEEIDLEDWYVASIVDQIDGWGPSVHVLVDADSDVVVDVYYDCVRGTASVEECEGASMISSEEDGVGCRGSSGSEFVLDPSCQGSGDEGGWAIIAVRRLDPAACISYSVETWAD